MKNKVISIKKHFFDPALSESILERLNSFIITNNLLDRSKATISTDIVVNIADIYLKTSTFHSRPWLRRKFSKLGSSFRLNFSLSLIHFLEAIPLNKKTKKIFFESLLYTLYSLHPLPNGNKRLNRILIYLLNQRNNIEITAVDNRKSCRYR